jgi:hypothetical protein
VHVDRLVLPCVGHARSRSVICPQSHARSRSVICPQNCIMTIFNEFTGLRILSQSFMQKKSIKRLHGPLYAEVLNNFMFSGVDIQ